MPERNHIDLELHLAEAGYALLVLAWFLVPLFARAPGALVPPLLPVAFMDAGSVAIIPFLLVACVVSPIPVLAAFKICAPFLASRIPSITDPKRIVPIVLDILLSGLVLATLVIHLLATATGPGYFLRQPALSWVVLAASVIVNVLAVAFLIVTLAERDELYREYREFRRGVRPREGGALAVLRRPGIQGRLVLIFLPFIAAIVVIPAVVVVRDFRRATLDAAIETGETLAEQAAIALGGSYRDENAVGEYIALQAWKNAGAATPFQVLLFARRNERTGTYEYAAATDRSRIGARANRAGIPLDRTSWRRSADGSLYEFTAPVVRMYTTVGFVTVEYARDTIVGPGFRIAVKVALMAVVFFYAAIVLLHLFGRNLVHPILYLRVSVNAISRALDGMVKGKMPVSASLLQFKDRVRTRDEVKTLSDEIRAMTGVIRGVLPYVSASTLRAAERQRPKSQRRNLAFLFTDIRGFSSLCEGQNPDRVVELLNRYLGIQADIIRANGGDVDKFVGDEIMATFDGLKKELHACRAGVEIRAAMAAERELAELASRDVVSIGIGINAGTVVFGSVGAGDRMDFTSIGDAVNLAARLEKANKSYRTKTLISETVHERVGDDYLCREIDLLTVKGKRQPVRVFELLQERGKATDRICEIKRVFEEGLALYRRRQWAQAEKVFGFLKEKFHDETSEVFLRRIALFKLDPPPRSWDGVFDVSLT